MKLRTLCFLAVLLLVPAFALGQMKEKQKSAEEARVLENITSALRSPEPVPSKHLFIPFGIEQESILRSHRFPLYYSKGADGSVSRFFFKNKDALGEKGISLHWQYEFK